MKQAATQFSPFMYATTSTMSGEILQQKTSLLYVTKVQENEMYFFAGVSPDPVEESFLIESYVAKLNLTPALRRTICEEHPKISE